MTTVPPDWASVVTAVATAFTAAILLVAAIFAGVQARQARLAPESQSRPFVVIDFDTQTERSLIFLKIANVGSTMAREIRFDFDPPLTSTFDGDARPTLPDVKDLNVFRRGISSLAPGKSISTLFDSAIQRRNPPHADVYTVRLRYLGDRGKRYEETMSLDLEVYWGYLRDEEERPRCP